MFVHRYLEGRKRSSSRCSIFVSQVFLEFAKEQESEEDVVGPLSTTFQWQRLQQDGSTSQADSTVQQL